jgi:hypothetical protein
MEASYRRINILSTEVGLAPVILDPDCICQTPQDFVNKFESGLNRIDANYNNVTTKNLAEHIIPKIDNALEQLC